MRQIPKATWLNSGVQSTKIIQRGKSIPVKKLRIQLQYMKMMHLFMMQECLNQ